jgi:hypothetical protein
VKVNEPPRQVAHSPRPESNELPRWVTPTEAAYLIGIGLGELEDRLRAARIPASPVGRRKKAQLFLIATEDLIRTGQLPRPAKADRIDSRAIETASIGRKRRHRVVGAAWAASIAAVTAALALAVALVAPSVLPGRPVSLQTMSDRMVQTAGPIVSARTSGVRSVNEPRQRIRQSASKLVGRRQEPSSGSRPRTSPASPLRPRASRIANSPGAVDPAASSESADASPGTPPKVQPKNAEGPGEVYRAFSADSEWNRPLSNNAPIDHQSAAIIAEIKTYDKGGYPRIVVGSWAEPIYWGRIGDPIYTIKPIGYGPTLKNVRIPRGARPSDTSDGQMSVFDLPGGTVFKLTKARFDPNLDTWIATGTSQYSLASKGLACSIPESDRTCPMNSGHRGYPPGIHAVRYDEVSNGINGGQGIRHVLKVALDRTAACHVYPGAGHESNKGGVLTCEGLVLRVKPAVNLSARGMSVGCLEIAMALQRYGAVIGDTGGVAMAIKVENLDVEGRIESWSTFGVSTSCFQGKLTFDDFEVIARGYHRP